MADKKYSTLLKRYRTGESTPEENAIIESWYNEQIVANAEIKPAIDFEVTKKEIWSKIEVKIPTNSIKIKSANFKWISIAASLIIISFLSIYFINGYREHKRQFAFTKIAPGKSQATLTYGNGQKLLLNGNNDKTIPDANQTSFNFAKDGHLVFLPDKSTITKPYSTNRIDVPRGGQFKIELSDGTNIWLNSESSIIFPSQFTSNERNVILTGEAYFEVAKDKHRQFKVHTKSQDIKVLGTHFLITDYEDIEDKKTTLLEGSVKIINNLTGENGILTPGRESLINNQSLNYKTADIEEAMSWKEGYFKFKSESLSNIFKKLSRWYDIDFDYKPKIVEEKFTGKVSRDRPILDVLKMLKESANIEFILIYDSNGKERRILIKN